MMDVFIAESMKIEEKIAQQITLIPSNFFFSSSQCKNMMAFKYFNNKITNKIFKE